MSNPPTDKTYVGIMTGTSLDGVDAVVVNFYGDLKPATMPFHLPLTNSLRQALLDLQNHSPNEIQLLAEITKCYTELCAEAFNGAIEQAKLPVSAIRAIGWHGQTIRHNPQSGYTIQLANGALLAELTNTDVVCDFRSGDIARGGQGAPLAPAFHLFLLANGTPRTIVNIGGMANVTIIDGTDNPQAGFDTGPGCALLNGMAQRHLDSEFDLDGDWAASGKVNQNLLNSLLAHPFFVQIPPKSCGREQFNLAWLDNFSEGIAPQDIQATLLELTAKTLADAIVGEPVLCGGGARNRALVVRLTELVDITPINCEQLGYPPEWVEPAAFAYFAKLRITEQPLPIAWATGAKGDGITGALYRAVPPVKLNVE